MLRPRNTLPYEAPAVIDASAPQHDPSQDGPISRDNLTPTSIWANIFKNTPGSTYVSTTPAQNALQQRPAAPAAPPLPSLTQLANGTNHAQRWMSPEQGLASVQKYMPPAPITAPASTTFHNMPGTRQPFIAGANGVNVGPSIAAKVNPRDPTLDQDYVRRGFSWSSAFR